MATIESKKVQLSAAPQEVFNYVHDLNNLIELLPGDKVSEWKGSEDSCSFKVAGGYNLGLERASASEPTQIVLRSTPSSPLKFDLDIRFSPVNSGTEAGMVCNIEANPFVMMMVEKPLRNLFDFIADRLNAKFN